MNKLGGNLYDIRVYRNVCLNRFKSVWLMLSIGGEVRISIQNYHAFGTKNFVKRPD